MNSEEQTILIVEDDVPLAELIAASLRRERFRTEIESHGGRALDKIRAVSPDLVILDVMLPGQDGFAICRQSRAFYTNPILMLTARDEDMDQILGLELGADDYVIKPVMPRVLLARVRALLRRGERVSKANGESISLGELEIKIGERRVLAGGREVDLTTSEFDLLLFLAQRAGNVVSRQDLYKALRGIDYDGIDRAMDLRVSKLRSRLREAAPNAALIKTIHGRGYLMVRSQP
jgi:two-component system response regulator RstA